MSFKKSFGSFSLASLTVGALVYGCSSSSGNAGPGTTNDAGGTMDSSGMHNDGAAADSAPHPDAANDAVANNCSPASVTNFTPPAYKGVNQQVGACTAQQISDFFTACFQTGHTKAMCDAFKAGAMTCAGCIEGPDTATKLAASVIHGGVVTLNVPGCLELLGGTTGLDCAHTSQVAEQCTNAACDVPCPVTDDASFQLYLACITQASQNGCMMYAAAQSTCQMSFASSDGGVAACVSGQTFQDIYNNIVPVICGGGASDGGGGG